MTLAGGVLYPLTFGQRWLQHVASMAPELSRPVQRLYRLAPPISTDRLIGALRRTVAANESLRLQLVETESGWQQQFRDDDADIAGTRVTGGTAEHRSVYAMRLLIDDGRKTFDLTRDPPLLARFAEFDGERVLALTVDHIAADETSFDLLESRIEAAYADESENGSGGAFAAYIAREERYETSAAASLAYWQKRLAGLPLASDSRERTWAEAGRTVLTIDEDAFRELAASCRAAACSPAHAIEAALLLLLHAIDGRTDVVLSTPVSNRSESEDAGVIGNISTLTYPRFTIEPTATCGELLRHVRGRLLEAIAHRYYDYAALSKAVAADAESRGGEVDFTIGCSFIIAEERPRQVLGERLDADGPAEPHVPANTFTISTRQSARALVLEVLWDRERYSLTEDDVRDAMLSKLAIVNDPAMPVARFLRGRA